MIWRLLAPAKVNLGLAVLGKRPDGYHEIATLLQAISLDDVVTAEIAAEPAVTVDDPSLDGEENLALRALRRWSEASGRAATLRLRIEKRIPAAAGLGGASSDAATALRLAEAALGPMLKGPDLHRVAAGLGSDVPFFLGGPAALATGRGEVLHAVPPAHGLWFVLATPRIELPRKTATLYGLLSPADFGSAEAILDVAARLRDRLPPHQGHLANAFERPLLAAYPELGAVPAALRTAGAEIVALSGAGPTWYGIAASERDAAAVAAKVASRLPDARVQVARALTAMPEVATIQQHGVVDERETDSHARAFDAMAPDS